MEKIGLPDNRPNVFGSKENSDCGNANGSSSVFASLKWGGGSVEREGGGKGRVFRKIELA